MKGGLRRLVHPGTPAHDIDVEGTRAERQRIHDVIRRHNELVEQLEMRSALERPEPEAADS